MWTRRSRWLLLYSLLLVLTACSMTREISNDVQVQRAVEEIAEHQLMDVWIALFDAGELPDDEDDAQGLSLEIREAEARYLPVQLRDTLEKTGYWGAVRVVPQGTGGGEILVQGTIVVSDGEKLVLAVTVLDATGRRWFKRTYGATVAQQDYQQTDSAGPEVFQALYNAIANDLAEFRADLDADEINMIRQVAGLRFANELAPDAFGGFLQEADSGRISISRLPALDDPMVARVSAIRERDFLLVDTLNGHFDNFSAEMREPYFQWRVARLEELEAMREIQRDARNRKLLGAAAIIGAIAIEAMGSDNTRASTGSLRDLMIVGGAYAVKTGFDKDSEATIHQDAIIELGSSFVAETQPLVVEVEGETHQLTGSAETQYKQWRGLLKRIYASETGLPETENQASPD